ncbi:DUF7535 family protein [Halomarina oriensis]|uniref:Uncharacterized protein n=1 Tax=Halomarina oriensis TaxID=671145 RepID=A0A6B0GT46_9EURY|nr:hypothetical protein [Halomarina oriensis]MWG34878.1 hypothetical protein [Halomarina oriensis]
MSESDDPGVLREAIRSVTPASGGRPNMEMDVLGWGVFLGMVVLLVPLLPFILIVWLVSKLAERGERRLSDEN